MGKSYLKNDLANQPAVSPVTTDPRTVLPRDQVQDFHDPYRVDGHYPEGTVCSQCGALYHNQHWHNDEERRKLLVDSGAANEVLCPACRKIDSRDPQGIVTIRGDYWRAHRDELLNLIRNEGERGVATNPLERIMGMREEGDALIVETTNEKLAQKIGRALHGAHKGNVEYQFPDANRLLRVYWERYVDE